MIGFSVSIRVAEEYADTLKIQRSVAVCAEEHLMEEPPFVIIWKMAFLSAQMPSVEQVSTQTPVYIFPDFESTAAATSPQETYSET